MLGHLCRWLAVKCPPRQTEDPLLGEFGGSSAKSAWSAKADRARFAEEGDSAARKVYFFLPNATNLLAFNLWRRYVRRIMRHYIARLASPWRFRMPALRL